MIATVWLVTGFYREPNQTLIFIFSYETVKEPSNNDEVIGRQEMHQEEKGHSITSLARSDPDCLVVTSDTGT